MSETPTYVLRRAGGKRRLTAYAVDLAIATVISTAVIAPLITDNHGVPHFWAYLTQCITFALWKASWYLWNGRSPGQAIAGISVLPLDTGDQLTKGHRLRLGLLWLVTSAHPALPAAHILVALSWTFSIQGRTVLERWAGVESLYHDEVSPEETPEPYNHPSSESDADAGQ